MDSSPTARIGLVLHPRRTPASAVARIATGTAAHGLELVATAEDVAGRTPRPSPTRAGPTALHGGCGPGTMAR